SAPWTLSANTDICADAMSIFSTRLSPVLAMNIVELSAPNASPLAPNGGNPAVASSGSCAKVVTLHPEHAAAWAILKIAPWNESEKYRLPLASNTMPFGAGAPADPNVMRSLLPSGLPTVRGPGAPIEGTTATSSMG